MGCVERLIRRASDDDTDHGAHRIECGEYAIPSLPPHSRLHAFACSGAEKLHMRTLQPDYNHYVPSSHLRTSAR